MQFLGCGVLYGKPVRFRLRPSEDAFYDFFTAAANNIVAAAQVLTEFSHAEGEYSVLSQRLREIEHAGDEVTHETIKTLNSTFVTPFDREDIYQLIVALDDVVDHMEAAVTLAHLTGFGDVHPRPAGFSESVEVLNRAARVTAEAMPRVKTRKDLDVYWIEINQLENDADNIYHRTLGEMFSGRFDALDVMKLRSVLDELEATADAFEKVANAVESIIVKEA